MTVYQMNHTTKLQVSGTLTALMQAGFVVRGFEGLTMTCGSGSRVTATCITKEGSAVRDVYVGGGSRDGWTVAWVDSDEREHTEDYSVQLSVVGEIRLTPVIRVSSSPAWR